MVVRLQFCVLTLLFFAGKPRLRRSLNEEEAREEEIGNNWFLNKKEDGEGLAVGHQSRSNAQKDRDKQDQEERLDNESMEVRGGAPCFLRWGYLDACHYEHVTSVWATCC